MQVIGLMGYVDKYDFIINFAKIIDVMDKSVLVIDATYDKKLKYVLPAIDTNAKYYITKYDNVDFAVGFDNLFELEEYAREHDVKIDLYDYVLIDIDCAETYREFNDREFDRKYLLIDTNILSVEKNKELVKSMNYNIFEGKIKFTKVLYKSYLSRASAEYLENQIALYDVEWQDEKFEIIMDEQDKMIDIDSQFSGVIELKKHTKGYITSIAQMVANLLKEDVREVIKQIKRGKN